MKISNSLTITRIILIPFFLILLINQYVFYAVIFFSIACLTDAFDGIFARMYNQKTKLGSFLDPVADKLLIDTSFTALALMSLIPEWLSIIVISRDVIIILGVTIFYILHKRLIISPTYIGKITTMLQMLTVLVALINMLSLKLDIVLWVFIWICTFFTISSGLDYIIITIKKFLRGI